MCENGSLEYKLDWVDFVHVGGSLWIGFGLDVSIVISRTISRKNCESIDNNIVAGETCLSQFRKRLKKYLYHSLLIKYSVVRWRLS